MNESLHFSRRIIDVLNHRWFDFAGFYTIVVTETVSDHRSFVLPVLTSCWSFHIVNVNVLLYDSLRSETIAYTYFPYSASACNEVIPVAHETHTDIFPDKAENFHRCPVFVTLYKDLPCIESEDGSEPDRLSGIEGAILRGLSQSLNFTLSICEHSERNILLAVRNSRGGDLANCLVFFFRFSAEQE